MRQGAYPPEPSGFPRLDAMNGEKIEPFGDSLQDPSFQPQSSSLSAVSRNATVRPYEDRYQYAWDEYVYRHPSASIFHLTAWKRVIEKVFKFEPRFLFVE